MYIKENFPSEAQLILKTVSQLETPVGKEKLALLLKGSKSKKVVKSAGYGAIYWRRLDEIENYIKQLIDQEFLTTEEIAQFRPIVRLTRAGAKALSENIDIELIRMRSPEKGHKVTITSSIRETGELFKLYKDINKVAEARNIAESTVYAHLEVLILFKEIELSEVVKEYTAIDIENAIQKLRAAGEWITTRRLKDLVPEASWGEIRCVMAGVL